MLDLSTLNREQLQAVLTTEGPLLVLAGAGSGKTRVITYRLAHLIERGVSPKNILCVTFTNKAAFEMRERARALVGKSVKGSTISTFHALGSQLLRAFGERVGLKKGFTISDGGDQLGTLRRILRLLKIDDRKFDAKKLQQLISQAKNAGVDPAQLRAQDGFLVPGVEDDLLPDDEYRVAAIEVYQRYQETLRAQNVVDFDDLLLLTGKLLAGDAEVLGRLQERWRYLQIDEYQDTNGAQMELMRLLAGASRNLCVVGDDDQSIYGWRGAKLENILSFEKHFVGAKVVKLETNYRSTGRILDVANAIIEKNPLRYDKRLRPAADAGDPVRVAAMDDEEAEAEAVTSAILALVAENVPLKDVAVLYRSNVQSRPIELALRTGQVRYRVVGGMDLFDRKEIKDALAYLKLLNNPEDEQSLRRVINHPPRGIGDGSIEKIDEWARERHLPFTDALERVHEVSGVPDKTQDAVAAFLSLLADHRRRLARQKASTVSRKLLEAVKLEEAVFASTDNAVSASRRVDNVREILKQVERFEQRKKSQKKRAEAEQQAALILAQRGLERTGERPEEEPEELDAILGGDDELAPDEEPGLDGFLRDLALGGWGDGGSKEDKEEEVTLSTIHAAKGLEWPHVFLVGVEEELLPHRRTVEGDGEIEEERRLAYVAVTRARRQLTISHAKARTRFGQIVKRDRSRFLEDLPEDAVEHIEGLLKRSRTEAEKDAIAKEWRQKIREKLGIGG
jgi:superfamily I DNA/RNA helicase